jgi:transposase
LGIARTAKKLKIKLSTAKSILRAFKSKGKILKKKHIKQKKKYQTKENKINFKLRNLED